MKATKALPLHRVSLILDPDIQYCDPFEENSESYRLFKQAFDRLLAGLDLDKENAGKEDWNPFGDFIKPGNFVVVKPNLVRHVHLEGGDIRAVIVNPIVIKLTLDYVFRALGNTGRVVLGDAHLQSADAEKIYEINQFDRFVEFYHNNGYRLEIKDFRREATIKDLQKLHYHFGRREVNPEEDFIEVNLKEQSLFYEVRHKFKRFRVTDYNVKLMQRAHNLIDNKYLIHKDILNSDVIINIPKLKTHRKAGFTCAMKNHIGINGLKDYLPHCTVGTKG